MASFSEFDPMQGLQYVRHVGMQQENQLLVPVAQKHSDSDSICSSYAAYHCEQMPEKRQLEGGKIYFASSFWRLEPILAAGGSMVLGVCSSRLLTSEDQKAEWGWEVG